MFLKAPGLFKQQLKLWTSASIALGRKLPLLAPLEPNAIFPDQLESSKMLLIVNHFEKTKKRYQNFT